MVPIGIGFVALLLYTIVQRAAMIIANNSGGVMEVVLELAAGIVVSKRSTMSGPACRRPTHGALSITWSKAANGLEFMPPFMAS